MKKAIEDIISYFHLLAEWVKIDDMQDVVSVVLLKIGLSPRAESFDIVKTAILRFYEDPDQLMVNSLYYDMAKDLPNVKSISHIETALRRSIKRAWAIREKTAWNLFFPGIRFTRRAPSNRDFLDSMVLLLNLWESVFATKG